MFRVSQKIGPLYMYTKIKERLVVTAPLGFYSLADEVSPARVDLDLIIQWVHGVNLDALVGDLETAAGNGMHLIIVPLPPKGDGCEVKHSRSKQEQEPFEHQPCHLEGWKLKSKTSKFRARL